MSNRPACCPALASLAARVTMECDLRQEARRLISEQCISELTALLHEGLCLRRRVLTTSTALLAPLGDPTAQADSPRWLKTGS